MHVGIYGKRDREREIVVCGGKSQTVLRIVDIKFDLPGKRWIFFSKKMALAPTIPSDEGDWL